MSTNEIKAIQSSLNTTEEWLSAVMETYDYADKDKAFILLRATLKTIRDRISTDEAFHFGSQLPAILRGFYFEGWDPSKKPLDFESAQGFLSSVKGHLNGHGDIDLEMAVPEAINIIFDKMGGNEREHVLSNLPGEVQEFIS